jgi:hypothetical protein
MTMTAFDDALSKLRQEARRRRMLRYKGAPRSTYKSVPRPTYEAADPAARTIVGEWFADELGNLTRIIEGA